MGRAKFAGLRCQSMPPVEFHSQTPLTFSDAIVPRFTRPHDIHVITPARPPPPPSATITTHHITSQD